MRKPRASDIVAVSEPIVRGHLGKDGNHPLVTGNHSVHTPGRLLWWVLVMRADTEYCFYRISFDMDWDEPFEIRYKVKLDSLFPYKTARQGIQLRKLPEPCLVRDLWRHLPDEDIVAVTAARMAR